jgi:hypothetical protein
VRHIRGRDPPPSELAVEDLQAGRRPRVDQTDAPRAMDDRGRDGVLAAEELEVDPEET